MTVFALQKISRMVLLCALGLGAFIWSQAQAQDMPAWRLASEAGSLRLYRTALVAERPQGALQAVASIDRRLGFAGGTGPQTYRLPFSFSVSPQVGYDRNFNGGFGADTIRLGDTEFTVTPETRAQASVYAGVQLGISQRFVWREGSAVSVNSSGTYRRAAQNGLEYRALNIRACSENQLGYLSAIDICLNRALVYRDRSTTRVTTASISGSRIFVQPNSLTEATATLAREYRPGYSRNTASAQLRHLDRRRGLMTGRIFAGERVEGRSLATFSFDLGYGWLKNDRFYSLGLTHQRDTGGQVLGKRLHQREYSINLTLPALFGLRPSVGYTVLRHDQQQFDTRYSVFAISLPPLRF